MSCQAYRYGETTISQKMQLLEAKRRGTWSVQVLLDAVPVDAEGSGASADALTVQISKKNHITRAHGTFVHSISQVSSCSNNYEHTGRATLYRDAPLLPQMYYWL